MASRTPEDIAQRWFRPEIRALSAYHVPDPGDMVKLDAMENPYVWPDALRDEWAAMLHEIHLNRYPDPGARELHAALREAFGIGSQAGLMLGNGSDELIQILALAVAEPGHAILAPEPGFVMYRMIATFAGLKYVGVPLRQDDFGLDLEAMREAIATHDPAVVFLACPNNPTGNLFDGDAIEAVIESCNGLVVIDEAYAAFASRSFLPRLGEWPNLLVMRTVSKMGLAGLRLGLLAGPPALIGELDKLRLPYNINVLTQASAIFALRHRQVLDEQTARIRSDREALYQALSAIDAIHVWPSEANFLLMRVPEGRASAVFDGLRQHGVLVKNLDPAGGMLKDCLRVTVGTPEENSAFVTALRESL